MDFIKKNLNLIVLACAALFALLTFATMAGAAVTATASLGGWSATAKGSCYELLGNGGDYKANGVCIAAFILAILALVATLASCASICLNQCTQYVKFVACGAAVLFLVAGILWFCSATGDYKDWSLGAGAVFTALFCLIGAGANGYVGAMGLLGK